MKIAAEDLDKEDDVIYLKRLIEKIIKCKDDTKDKFLTNYQQMDESVKEKFNEVIDCIIKLAKT